jgi:acetoin utilization protein AcuB
LRSARGRHDDDAPEANAAPASLLQASSLMETTKIREVMTARGLFDVSEGDSLASAAHRMAWLRCRHLPVTREGEVIGVLSERDVLAWKADGHALDGPNDRVRSAMSSPVITATPDEDIGEACARMIAARVSCLPVVMHGRLVGIVTSTDLLGRHVTSAFERAADADVPAAFVMTPAPFTALPGDPLLKAADVMAANAIRHLPIVDDSGGLVGIVSERDLRTALGIPAQALEQWASALGRDRTVREVMTEAVECVRPEQPLSQVITTMVTFKVGALPVVDDQRHPLGIISYLDVLRAVRR